MSADHSLSCLDVDHSRTTSTWLSCTAVQYARTPKGHSPKNYFRLSCRTSYLRSFSHGLGQEYDTCLFARFGSLRRSTTGSFMCSHLSELFHKRNSNDTPLVLLYGTNELAFHAFMEANRCLVINNLQLRHALVTEIAPQYISVIPAEFLPGACMPLDGASSHRALFSLIGTGTCVNF